MMQVNDINATDTSFDDETIVTGDDFGLVKLFRFPSIKKGEEMLARVRIARVRMSSTVYIAITTTLNN